MAQCEMCGLRYNVRDMASDILLKPKSQYTGSPLSWKVYSKNKHFCSFSCLVLWASALYEQLKELGKWTGTKTTKEVLQEI